MIISNGNHGGYKHPRQSTLDQIRSSLSNQVSIYQTNKLLKLGNNEGGNVGDEFIADLEPDGDEGTILVTVGEDDYEVKFISTDKSWSFPIEK